jgi:hypothetical protein
MLKNLLKSRRQKVRIKETYKSKTCFNYDVAKRFVILLSVILFTSSCYSQEATITDEEIFQKIEEYKKKGSREFLLKEIQDFNRDFYMDIIKSARSNSYKAIYIESVFLEPSEFVYQNIRKRIQLDSICSKYINKTLVIDIEIQDSKVSFAEEKMYEFDENENLLSYSDGFGDIAKAIIGLDFKEFDFVDNPNWFQGNFRIEISRLCSGNLPDGSSSK